MMSLDRVFNAQTVLKNIIRETNVVRAYGISPDCELFLKPENLQITDSFKVRDRLFGGQPRAGRCTCGNEKRNPLSDLSAGYGTDLQGGGDQGIRRGCLSGGGLLR